MVQQGRERRAAVLELLGRFTDMGRSQIADCLFSGDVRKTNRVLLSLVRIGRVHRFRAVPRGEYIYSLRRGPTHQTEHHLAIAGIYAALVRGLPPGRTVAGEANVKVAGDLVPDLLAISDNLAVLAEVHRGTTPVAPKLDRYWSYFNSDSLQQAPWWSPSTRVVLWLVASPASVAWLERTAKQYRVAGLDVVVTTLGDAHRDPWGALGERALRWKLPGGVKW